MYTMFGPSTLWPQNSMAGNQQVIYAPYPGTYVLGPMPSQPALNKNFYPAYTTNSQMPPAWAVPPAPAAAPAPDGRDNPAQERLSSSDDVFLPNGVSGTGNVVYAAPYHYAYLPPAPPPAAVPAEREMPTPFSFVNTNAFPPSTPGVRLPERYTRVRSKSGLKKTPLKRNKRRSAANGSLNSTGGTSGASSHNTTALSNSQNATGPPDLHLANISDVAPANTSGSGSDTSPAQARSRLRTELSSVSSSILPAAVRAAINEDPPEPTNAGAPLKTSSPIRDGDEFLSLPTVIPTSMFKSVRETLKNLPAPIGAEVARQKRVAGEGDQESDKENVAEPVDASKRRDGRYIIGATKNPKDVSNPPKDEKVSRLTSEESGDEMDQCHLILKQRKQMGAAEEQARRREEFLLILEAERERQRRIILPRNAPKMACKFCRNNGESEDVYTKHRLHHKERTVCPILRHYVCRLCNSTGDFAHTIRHCPFNNRKDRIAWKATFMV